MAVITLWIVTADQGHNKTIVAAILEKVLNKGDTLSEGYTSLLNLIINSKGIRRPVRQWQVQTQGGTEPARRFPSSLIGVGEGEQLLMHKPFGYMLMCLPSLTSHLLSSELATWSSPLLRDLIPTVLSFMNHRLKTGNHLDKRKRKSALCLVKLDFWEPRIFWTNFSLGFMPLEKIMWKESQIGFS